jgi:glycosyltransferase involved in cell wall biosynthesis
MAISNQTLNDHPENSDLIVMLTADSKIDRRILLEADSLEAAGWRVIILAMPLDPGDKVDDPRIVRIDADGFSVSKENAVLLVYRRLRKRLPMNSRFMRAAKAFAWRYLEDQEFFFVKLFSNAISRFSPRIFVAHDLPMLPVAWLASKRCGAKLVYDSHELYCEQELPALERRRWVEIESKYVVDCDAVITVNASIARELERRYRIRDVNVIYNAERCEEEPTKKRIFNRTFGLAHERKIVLFQGGLYAGRNLEVLIRAMRHLRNPLLNLVLMGDGRLRISLENTVKKLRLSDRVHFHPAVPQKDLLAFSACADAGVIPYQPTCLNNYYCTPNKLFEYIAAGVPIIASDLPEIRNIVTTHRIGLVGDLSTPNSAAQLIEEFFSDQKLLEGWREQVMQARQHVCWGREMEKIARIFSGLR